METVPACETCNAGSNLEDEYFRNTLVLMFDQDHPEKEALFGGKVGRSLRRYPEWIKDSLKRLKVQPMFSPSGLWLGNFAALPLDRARFDRNLQKIIKGLYFLICKQRFPVDGQIRIIGNLDDTTWESVRFIEQHLFPPTFDFGDDVFEWRFAQTKDGASVWKLAFYRSVVFYALAFEEAVSPEVPA